MSRAKTVDVINQLKSKQEKFDFWLESGKLKKLSDALLSVLADRQKDLLLEARPSSYAGHFNAKNSQKFCKKGTDGQARTRTSKSGFSNASTVRS